MYKQEYTCETLCHALPLLSYWECHGCVVLSSVTGNQWSGCEAPRGRQQDVSRKHRHMGRLNELEQLEAPGGRAVDKMFLCQLHLAVLKTLEELRRLICLL